MKINLWVLVTKDDRGAVHSIYSPDFHMFLLHADRRDLNYSYRSMISVIIKNLCEDYNLTLTPKDIKDLIDIKISELQYWDCINIEQEHLKKFFSKLLPVSGIIANFIATATGGATTYMALHINSSNNNNPNDIMESLNIFGATFDSIISLIMYNNSNTNALMAAVGEYIDNKICNRNHNNHEGKKLTFNYIKLATFIIVSATVALNTLIASVRRYQELKLLVKKFAEINHEGNKHDQADEYEFYSWLVIYPFILTMAYSGIAFQASFIEKQLQKIFNKKQPNKEIPDSNIALLNETMTSSQTIEENYLPKELLFEYRSHVQEYELRSPAQAPARLSFS